MYLGWPSTEELKYPDQITTEIILPRHAKLTNCTVQVPFEPHKNDINAIHTAASKLQIMDGTKIQTI
jgi:hypothetical protein